MENVKARAWEFLTKHNIGNLPIDMLSLNFKDVGFKIISYDEGKGLLESMGLSNYSKKHDGFAVNHEGDKLIFYNDTLPYSQKNFVIGHEVGHVVLSHIESGGKIYGKSKNKSTESLQEKEADKFSLALLMPAPILAEIEAISPDTISRITGLPTSLSNQVVSDIEKEKTLIRTAIEENLLYTFADFTAQFRKFKPEKDTNVHLAKKKGGISTLLLVSVACFITALVVLAYTYKNKIYDASPNLPAPLPITQELEPLPVEADAPSLDTTMDQSKEEVEIPKADFPVFTTIYGEKYHLKSCYHLKGKANLKEFTTEEAEERGFTPCKDCSPDIKK